MSERVHSKSRHERRPVPVYEFKGFVIRVYQSARGRFTARFSTPTFGARRVEKASESLAVEAAREEIRRLTDNELQAAMVEELSAAKILEPAKYSVIEAARLVAVLTEKLKPFDKGISEAVEFFIDRHTGKQITVSALVQLFLKRKEEETGYQNVKDLRSKLESAFCRAFGSRLIRSLGHAELAEWINNLSGGLRKKRNHHAAVVTLMAFAKELDFLPKDRPSEIEQVKKKKVKPGPKVIFTPDELRALIHAGLIIKSPALLPLLIQSFAGLRHEEIEQTDPTKDRLRLNDIYLEQPIPEIHVRQEVAKNGEERFIPIVPELVAWIRALAPAVFGEGKPPPPADPVYPRLSLYKDYLRLAQKAGFRWKKNGLRKSFNTYDSALSGSLKVTAESAGNSPEMIRRYYKAQVRQLGIRALDWFSISPRGYSSLIRHYVAHVKANPPKIGKRGSRKKKDYSTKDSASETAQLCMRENNRELKV